MEFDVTNNLNPVVALVMFAIWLTCVVVMTWAYVRIVQKAGYSGWKVLWMVVPIANIVVFLVFAFGRWPIEEKIARLEARVF